MKKGISFKLCSVWPSPGSWKQILRPSTLEEFLEISSREPSCSLNAETIVDSSLLNRKFSEAASILDIDVEVNLLSKMVIDDDTIVSLFMGQCEECTTSCGAIREYEALPAGTRVTYHPYAMGRMESIWGNDYSQFRPDRWLQNDVFSPVSPIKYPVFQGELRVCLGKEMAIMEMTTVIVSVLWEFSIKAINSSGELRPKFSHGLTASVAGGLPARVSRRI